jgi:uncharacterized membrane protein
LETEEFMDDTREAVVEQWIGWILRIGVWGSAALMVAGLIAAWVSGSTPPMPKENPSLGDLFVKLFSTSIDSITLMFSGLVFLMLTPFLRVLAAVLGFLAERDLKFVAVALIVFGMLLGELLFSLR